MSKNNKRKCCRNKRNVPAAGLKENNIDFDYDKFAEAIIKAENKITEEKIRKQKEEDEEFQRILDENIKYPTSQISLINLCQNLRMLKQLFKLKKKNKITFTTSYIFFNFINSCLLDVYSLCLYILIFLPVVLGLLKNNYFFCFIPLSILLFFIQRIIKSTQKELEETINKEIIMSFFNALTAFTAMILALITLILTAITLYITINPSSGLITL